MKTILFIIFVIGMIGLSSFGFVENISGWGITPIDTDEHSEFVDFQAIYQARMPIQFIIENTSYTGCGSFNAKISDRDANIIWGEGADALCAPPNGILRTYEIKIGYNEDHPLIINESGKYYIELEYDNGMKKREFKVRQNTAGGTIDRTVYPTPEQEVLCQPVLVNGTCSPIIAEKIKTIGDDAPFFGIFVYIDNLISWIMGK